MRIAICDDEEFYRAQVLKILTSYSSQHQEKELSFTTFSHGEDLIEAARKVGGFDLYILDIMMPQINGIQLGMQLREEGYEGKIIYLTSSEDFAIDSYRVKAFNYILKPFNKNAFFASLTEAIESISTQPEKSLIVKTKESTIKLNFDNIMYAELCRRIIIYHLTSGSLVESIMIRTSFSEAMQELLKDNRFVLCGTSKVINLQHITAIETDALIFKNKEQVYASKKACRDTRLIWQDYCLSKESNSLHS